MLIRSQYPLVLGDWETRSGGRPLPTPGWRRRAGQWTRGGTRRPTRPAFCSIATEDKEKPKKFRLFFVVWQDW